MALTVSDKVKRLVEAIQDIEPDRTTEDVLIDALERLQAEIRLREDLEHVRRGFEQLDRGESTYLEPSERGTFVEEAKQMLARGERPARHVLP